MGKVILDVIVDQIQYNSSISFPYVSGACSYLLSKDSRFLLLLRDNLFSFHFTCMHYVCFYAQFLFILYTLSLWEKINTNHELRLKICTTCSYLVAKFLEYYYFWMIIFPFRFTFIHDTTSLRISKLKVVNLHGNGVKSHWDPLNSMAYMYRLNPNSTLLQTIGRNINTNPIQKLIRSTRTLLINNSNKWG